MTDLYLYLSIVLAVYVLYDAKKRNVKIVSMVLWALATAIIPMLFFPLYSMKKPLKSGEKRVGGGAWNFLKMFIVIWTLGMWALTIDVTTEVGEEILETSGSDFEAGAGLLGAGIGAMLFLAIWFIVFIIATVFAFLLKKSEVVEAG